MASSTRSRTAARTTTARSARATSTPRRVSRSVRATGRTSTSAPAQPLTLPAVFPVETFPVVVEDGMVKVDVADARRKVRAVLARLEAEDAKEREEGVPREQRARQVARTTGQFLFALVAPQWDCEVLEIGGSRGYSSIWLGAGVRQLSAGACCRSKPIRRRSRPGGGTSPRQGSRRRSSSSRATRSRRCPQIQDVFDVVFIDAEKEDYERLFQLSRDKVEPGALVVADNVLSHAETLGRVLRGPAGRSDDRERHRPARPRPRALGRPHRTSQ